MAGRTVVRNPDVPAVSWVIPPRGRNVLPDHPVGGVRSGQPVVWVGRFATTNPDDVLRILNAARAPRSVYRRDADDLAAALAGKNCGFWGGLADDNESSYGAVWYTVPAEKTTEWRCAVAQSAGRAAVTWANVLRYPASERRTGYHFPHNTPYGYTVATLQAHTGLAHDSVFASHYYSRSCSEILCSSHGGTVKVLLELLTSGCLGEGNYMEITDMLVHMAWAVPYAAAEELMAARHPSDLYDLRGKWADRVRGGDRVIRGRTCLVLDQAVAKYVQHELDRIPKFDG